MEVTKPRDSVTELADRYNPVGTKSLKNSGPNAQQRQSVTAAFQNLPEAGGPEPSGAVSRENLTAAVSQLSDYVQSIRHTLDFSVKEDIGRTVVTVIDSETKQVIRQIPSDEILSILENIAAIIKDDSQEPKGVLMQAKA